MPKIVTYTCISGGEIIVTTKKSEDRTIAAYFGELQGRNLDDYERQVHKNSFAISPELNLVWSE